MPNADHLPPQGCEGQSICLRGGAREKSAGQGKKARGGGGMAFSTAGRGGAIVPAIPSHPYSILREIIAKF